MAGDGGAVVEKVPLLLVLVFTLAACAHTSGSIVATGVSVA